MKKQIAVAVALACISALSLAQQKPQQNAGWYAGLSGGRSATSFTTQDFSVSAYNRLFPASAGLISETTDKRGSAWRIFVGYNFDQNWALEGAYTGLGDAKFKLAGTGGLYAVGQAATLKQTHDSWSLAVKGTLPVSKEFDIFALLGATSNRTSLNRSATGQFATDMAAFTSSSNSKGYGMGGLGVEFKPTPKIGIRAEYQNYGKFGEQLQATTGKSGRASVDTWLIGASFKF